MAENSRRSLSACSDSFEKRYLVEDIRAVENKIEIGLREAEVVNTSWIGEEQTFFDDKGVRSFCNHLKFREKC